MQRNEHNFNLDKCKVYTVCIIPLHIPGAYQNGAAVMVRPLWCGDSMVLVFYGARQYGAMVPRIFLLFGIFGGPYKGRFVN